MMHLYVIGRDGWEWDVSSIPNPSPQEIWGKSPQLRFTIRAFKNGTSPHRKVIVVVVVVVVVVVECCCCLIKIIVE